MYYKHIKSCKYCKLLILGSILIITFLISNISGIKGYFYSLISTGSGQYRGIISEIRHHGLVFKTYSAHLKTGENSSNFEDFCILDKNLYDSIKETYMNEKVIITYEKKLGTAIWQCDPEDSNDIITSVKIIK